MQERYYNVISHKEENLFLTGMILGLFEMTDLDKKKQVNKLQKAIVDKMQKANKKSYLDGYATAKEQYDTPSAM